LSFAPRWRGEIPKAGSTLGTATLLRCGRARDEIRTFGYEAAPPATRKGDQQVEKRDAVNYHGFKEGPLQHLLKRENIMSTDLQNHKVKIHIIEMDLDGVKCLRCFDPNGVLHVVGPEEASDPIQEYIGKYQPISEDPDVRALLAVTRPDTDMNLKMHTVLHLMEEFKEEIAEGMIISRELFLDALDAGLEPIDLESWVNSLGIGEGD